MGPAKRQRAKATQAGRFPGLGATLTARIAQVCVILALLLPSAGGAATPAISQDAGASAASALARQILNAAGLQGGLVAQIGCRDGRLAVALGSAGPFIVQALDRRPSNVAEARRRIQAAGLYGTVTAEVWPGKDLPYIDNLVNLLIIEDGERVAKDEMLRVLAPGGVAYVEQSGAWTRTRKSRPATIDQWTHYLHDPSNNAVAHDAEVGPPRHLQWTCGPAWSRHHDHTASVPAMVSAQGRVFYISDEGPREAIVLPPQWTLLARDAFNGALLWKQPIAHWLTQLWPLKAGPNQLPRRLVAVGDRVYVTLGIDAPVSALDAATGRIVRTYDGTAGTQEILVSHATMFLMTGPVPNKWESYRPDRFNVWTSSDRVNRDWRWQRDPAAIMAVETETGQVLWKTQTPVAPLTLTVDEDRVYYYDGANVVAQHRTAGKKIWTTPVASAARSFPTGYGPTLLVSGNVVLLSPNLAYGLQSKGDTTTALAAGTGKTLWSAPHLPGGHASPDDTLVVGGLAWSAALSGPEKGSGLMVGRDLRTGEVKSRFMPDVDPYWFWHHRCYRSRATDRYYLCSRTGIEFVDLAAKHWTINHWVRGECLYGFMPCNGLIYTPPNPCACYMESKITGFNALAPETASRRVPREVPDEGRLERGPAYDENPNAEIPNAKRIQNLQADWPTYRHDALRSGGTTMTLPAQLKRTWAAKVGGKLSALVVAEGKVFVSTLDTNTVHALDMSTGSEAWNFVAGGKVDSPPTVFAGRILFGAADGWVYCLRGRDGQLLWRFRAAPLDRRLVADERVESPWPVSGSVLVRDGAVYCVAGRSSFLDGGMRLLRLDATTGRKLSETLLDDRDPKTGGGLQSQLRGLNMPVALPDVLSCDGKFVYLRTQAFDLKGARRSVAPGANGGNPHLFSRSGFLDDSWFFRSYWSFAAAADSGAVNWVAPGRLAPSGRLMTLGEKSVYGFDRLPGYLTNSSVQSYYLYGAEQSVPRAAQKRANESWSSLRLISGLGPPATAKDAGWKDRSFNRLGLADLAPLSFHWAEQGLPLMVRAMALAGETLFVAGPPGWVDEEQALKKPDDPAIRAQLQAQLDALRGASGGKLLAFSVSDGKVAASFDLGAAPAFDGMAAAQGRLFLATLDGRVLCLGDQGVPLAATPSDSIVPLDVRGPRPAPAATSAPQGQ